MKTIEDIEIIQKSLEYEVKAARKDVRQHALKLQRILDRVLKELDSEDPLINSLGELQNAGPGFDCACARYAQAKHSLDIFFGEE